MINVTFIPLQQKLSYRKKKVENISGTIIFSFFCYFAWFFQENPTVNDIIKISKPFIE
jgi:hypothetical protein